MRSVALLILLLSAPLSAPLSGCEGAIWRDHARPPVAPVPSDGGAWRPPAPDAGQPEIPPPPPPRTDAGVAPPPSTDAGPPPPPVDGLGACTGTEAECEAARVINEHRTTHVHEGECNNALRWDDNLGRLAHEHQSGAFVRHSSHGYVENVGQAYGVRETAEYIIEWEAGIEEHCRSDGSYTVSHHCASMFCNNYTIGVGVFQSGETTYMTMMFGDERGQPGW